MSIIATGQSYTGASIITTNNAWTVVYQVSLSGLFNAAGNVIMAVDMIGHRDSDNANVGFHQDVVFAFDGTNVSIVGTPPPLEVSADLGMVLTAMQITVSGSYIQLQARGLTGSTIRWAGGFRWTIGQDEA
jgi:hypothetical protein